MSDTLAFLASLAFFLFVRVPIIVFVSIWVIALSPLLIIGAGGIWLIGALYDLRRGHGV
jgi:hypothetical protein